MESFIQKYFKFSYFILAFPYKLEWKKDRELYLHLYKSNVHYFLWWFGNLLVFTNSVVCCLLLPFFTKTRYLPEKEYVDLVFHSQWAIVSIMTIVLTIPHIKDPKGVMQLSNGCTALVQNLEQAKLQLI